MRYAMCAVYNNGDMALSETDSEAAVISLYGAMSNAVSPTAALLWVWDRTAMNWYMQQQWGE